ncbi:aromatic-ring-hydroxylating dioxygenase subunit beta [Tsukamurella sp. 8F]|uniref:aromatic-ring-hydroxylating dioxygenase subunit beta n=1 Tax=unclassified Tsukamurella TaxID=2633480 RepID=UPI0023B89B2E|nr:MULTISPECIES: aromatic-ring-hydroxylating dioxygenase subunit beta [unclassified Tsukamurella]MDF0529271.1 aromatic-ring-hydroxylating dioxygenase subunit beta [Tsukamurella sp. 8J]MDF0586892.1 aromatic-ring-hydroxylating dioxygenase subunit beta [Tsukamurella sp. 8F]
MSDLTFTDPRVLRAIELIWHEARLLDIKDYPAWEQLYTDDGLYVIPIDPDTEDFESSLNMVYDDKRMRNLRVQRMTQGYAPSAVAAARTVRIVSRFTVDSVDDTRVVVRSAQIINAFKRNEFVTLGGELVHTITLADSGDRISRKVVRLIDSEDAVRASGYLL